MAVIQQRQEMISRDLKVRGKPALIAGRISRELCVEPGMIGSSGATLHQISACGKSVRIDFHLDGKTGFLDFTASNQMKLRMTSDSGTNQLDFLGRDDGIRTIASATIKPEENPVFSSIVAYLNGTGEEMELRFSIAFSESKIRFLEVSSPMQMPDITLSMDGKRICYRAE